ncbi:uncharacterized protein [Musca autumnalis]|uniref:uncharacterized protein n=1 Tax=Musca autumnalis TaxID=221902 RepID=UPI003CF7A439
MPPKKEPNAHNNNSNNNETATQSETTTTTTSASNTTNTNNTGTTVVAAAATNMSETSAAEQRTVAFHANAKLCRLVRKCPWMYDRNHHNYAKKHILDKSWCKIARECNDSVASCKERWRNIRAAFARSINIYKTHSGPNRIKPYYLHKELSFLVKPMMEGRDRTEETHEISENGLQKEEYTEGEEEDDDVEFEDDDQHPDLADDDDLQDNSIDMKSAFEALNPDITIQTEGKFHKTLKDFQNSQKREHHNGGGGDYDNSSAIYETHDFSTSDAEQDFHDGRYDDNMSHTTETERRVMTTANHHTSNPLKRPMQLDTETFEMKRLKFNSIPMGTSEADLRFLEALLPDMALMNTKQKIIFKRKIYQTLEEVFENANDFPNLKNETKPQVASVSVAARPSVASLPTTTSTILSNQNSHSMNNNNNSSTSTTTTTMQGGSQVKQTVLTVNSSTARNLINNIANLSEAELQKVNGFLQTSLRNVNISVNTNPNNTNNNNNTNSSTLNHTTNITTRLSNGTSATIIPASSAAARLLQSTPKITITKVTCPPPASLRNMTLVNKATSPNTGTVSTTIHHTPATPVMTSNVHSTTSTSSPVQLNNAQQSVTTVTSISTTNGTATTTSSTTAPAASSGSWTQIMPLAIKDEIEDVDID